MLKAFQSFILNSAISQTNETSQNSCHQTFVWQTRTPLTV